MADEFDKAKDLFKWNERFFSIVGVWPLQTSHGKFSVWVTYYLLHIIQQMADLIHVSSNFELVVTNLSESSLQVIIFVKLVVLKFSSKSKTLVRRVTEEIDAKSHYSPEEKKIYLSYNRMAKTFFKIWVTMGIASATGYYFKPLQVRFGSASENETIPFTLAYRVRLFFEINDTTTFYLMWLYQAPVMYMGIWHTAAIGFLFSLVLHVCGQLSILSFRIKNLDLEGATNDETLKTIFRDILSKHCGILELAKDINELFGLILAEELIVSTVLIGLTGYAALMSLDSAAAAEIFSFFVYAATMLFLVYGYCAAGEHLVTESTNLYTAYYQCLWYDMPDSFKKQLIICMIGASKPIQLTAAGIYIFSLVNFMGVVKTAAGYLSMLRTMI